MFKEELKEVHSEFVALLDFLCEQEEIRIDTFNIGRQGFEIRDRHDREGTVSVAALLLASGHGAGLCRHFTKHCAVESTSIASSVQLFCARALATLPWCSVVEISN